MLTDANIEPPIKKLTYVKSFFYCASAKKVRNFNINHLNINVLNKKTFINMCIKNDLWGYF